MGISCGVMPGPLLALVLAQTLRHGAREGCKVALSPLLADVPVIGVTMALAARLTEFDRLLGWVSVAGGVFLLYLAGESWVAARRGVVCAEASPRSWSKGLGTNLLSPHPWLFWLTVGMASLTKALAAGWLAAGVFLLGFYGWLVGIKVAVALLAARSRDWMTGRVYRVGLRCLAVLLGGFALLLLREGGRYLGWV